MFIIFIYFYLIVIVTNYYFISVAGSSLEKISTAFNETKQNISLHGTIDRNKIFLNPNNKNNDIIYLISNNLEGSLIVNTIQEHYYKEFIGEQIAILVDNKTARTELNFIENESTPLTIFSFVNYFNLLNNPNLLKLQHSVTRNTWIFQSEAYLPQDLLILKLNLTSTIYYFDNTSNLYEIYGIKNGRQATFIKNLKTSLMSLGSVLARRLNLEGKQLEVAHVKKAPILTNSGAETLSGGIWGADLISYQILAYMQDLLNFRIQFHNASTWVYAEHVPNDQNGINGTYFGGMALMLNTGEVDLALSNTGLWANKNFSFLFVTRVYKEIHVYYHQISSSSSGNIYSDVFPTDVLVFLFLLITIILFLSSIFFNEPSSYLMTWTLSIFSQQGQEEPETKFQAAGRIFIISVQFFCLMFYVVSSAFLLAKLSSEEEIRDINGLIKRGYTFGIWKDSILDNGFKLGTLKPTSPIWPVRSLYKPYTNEMQGIAEVVETKKFGLISHQNFFLSYLSTLLTMNICGNMRQLTISDEKRWGSAFVKPNSEFRDHFNYARLRMFQVGLTNLHLKQIARQIEDGKPSCYFPSLSVTAKHGGIYFKEVIIPFYIFLFGFVACLIVFSLEILLCVKK